MKNNTKMKCPVGTSHLPPLINDVITDSKCYIDNIFADTWKKLKLNLLGFYSPPLGAKKWMNKVPVEYPAFERNEKVER